MGSYIKSCYLALSSRNESKMKYFKPNFLSFLFLIIVLQLPAQSSVGTWKDYLNYSKTIGVAKLNDQVYTATRNAVFIYNTADNSLERLNKVNGLSDVNIVLISAHQPSETIFIGYANGNMDILNNRSIFNFAAIKNSSVVGDKAIRHITYYENRAFISTGVGILEFDLDRREVRETYTISPSGNVSTNETAVLNDTLFAATNDGLYFGFLQNDLTIFSNWELDLSTPAPFTEVKNCAVQNGRLYANIPAAPTPALYMRNENFLWDTLNQSGSITKIASSPSGLLLTSGYYIEQKESEGIHTKVFFSNYGGKWMNAKSLTADADGVIWIADDGLGLVKRNTDNSFEFIYPDGPATNRAFDIDLKHSQLWVATGAPERPGTWNNSFILDGFYSLINGKWRNYTHQSNPELLDTLFFDVPKVYVDPDDENQVYVGSYFSGFASVQNQEIEGFYSDYNTSLGERTEYVRSDGLSWVGVAGFAKDHLGNTWITNSYTNNPLSVKTKSGTWKSFNLLGPNGLGTNKNLLDVIVTQQNQIWAIVNRGGIVVFDPGSSIADDSDDKVRLMTAQIGKGGLPDNEVLCISEDLDGEIWVGTVDGVAVFYSPFDALTDRFSDARKILVQQNGVYQYLLEGQQVSSIAVDGANRKWIGTFGAGVFLMSSNGTEEIQRFTVENSPLISNMINDIVIDPKTGEVFMATSEGIVSYISDATQGLPANNCSSVYPNPVRENYSGPISITGLMRDSQVRITDTRGNLIFKTVSNGGKAVWDGKNMDGQRVATGVYFALSTDTEGESTCVSKILVIK